MLERKAVALNLPGLSLLLCGENTSAAHHEMFIKNGFPILRNLQLDREQEVRCGIAMGFHDVIAQPGLSESLFNEVRQIFFELLNDPCFMVLNQLFKNIEKIIQVFLGDSQGKCKPLAGTKKQQD